MMAMSPARSSALASESGAKPNPKAKLGQGGRFAAMKQELGAEKGVRDPGALAAYIGRKKLGAKKFNGLAARGQ